MHKNTGRTSKSEIEQSHFSWHIDAHDVLRRMRTLGTLLYVIHGRSFSPPVLHLHHGGHPLHLPGRSGKTLDHGPRAGLRWALWEVKSLTATKLPKGGVFFGMFFHTTVDDHSQIM